MTDSPELFAPAHVARSGTLTRVAPFAAVALVAELSLALPPGPVSMRDTYVSVALLVLSAASVMVSTTFLPRWTDVVTPLLYVGSTLALILAAGGSSAGIGLVVLLPILWAALYLDLWKAFLVVLAVVAIEFVTTYTPVDLSDTVRSRRELIFLLVGALIVLSIYEIRLNFSRSDAQREARESEMALTIREVFEQNRVTSILGNLVEMLNFCDVEEEAYEVFDFAARQLFVQGGSIAILDETENVLEVKCNWYEHGVAPSPFAPDLCRSAALGQPFESDLEIPPCAHFVGNVGWHTLCHPLMVRRELVGLISLSIPDDEDADAHFQDAEHYRQYARLIGNQFSIWLASYKLRESLRNLSIRDPLTNLFNRRFMIETLHREMTITTRSHEQTSVIQIDIDHFKAINDAFGHEVGDLVLCSVAEIMLGLFRESDVPCRSGGEEFTMILPRCSWDIAHLRALELQARVAEMAVRTRSNETPPTPPTLSIGIATAPEHGLTGEDLLRGADAALYSAKAAGRNRIVRASLHEGADTPSKHSPPIVESDATPLWS
jgi:diguanylate cyclase (GGDEF)-like protein